VPPSVYKNLPTCPTLISLVFDYWPDEDKTELIMLEFFMDPDNPASKYSWQFAIFFKDGCKFQTSISSGEWPSGRLKTCSEKTRMVWKGSSLAQL
jgi:hypothetical protein